MTSSLDGANINTTTSSLLKLELLSFIIDCIIGIAKAKVFPEPVHALTHTSLFDKNNGTTAFYTLVTLSNFILTFKTSIIL